MTSEEADDILARYEEFGYAEDITEGKLDAVEEDSGVLGPEEEPIASTEEMVYPVREDVSSYLPKRGIGEGVMDLAFESDTDKPLYTPEDVRKETENDKVLDAVKLEENSIRKGWDDTAKRWSPHISVEDKADWPANNGVAKDPKKARDTIAYGHKLTNDDITKGILIDGVRYPVAKKDPNGNMEINNQKYSADTTTGLSEELSDKLFRQDWEKAKKKAPKNWKGFDKMPEKYKRIVVALVFNMGSIYDKAGKQAGDKAYPSLHSLLTKGIDRSTGKKLTGDALNAQIKEHMLTSGLINRRDKIFDSVDLV